QARSFSPRTRSTALPVGELHTTTTHRRITATQFSVGFGHKEVSHTIADRSDLNVSRTAGTRARFASLIPDRRDAGALRFPSSLIAGTRAASLSLIPDRRD